MVSDSLLLTLITTGLTSSFQLSLPFVICHGRFLIQGSQIGAISYLATVIGQISFLGLLTLGSRELFSIWYTGEPILYAVGFFISMKILLSFYKGEMSLRISRNQLETIFLPKTWNYEIRGMLLFSFFLPWLIPNGLLFDSSLSINLLLGTTSFKFGLGAIESFIFLFVSQAITFIGLLFIGFSLLFLYNFFSDQRKIDQFGHRSLNPLISGLGLGLTVAVTTDLCYRFFINYVEDLEFQTSGRSNLSTQGSYDPRGVETKKSKYFLNLSHVEDVDLTFEQEELDPPTAKDLKLKRYRYHNPNRIDQEHIYPIRNYSPLFPIRRKMDAILAIKENPDPRVWDDYYLSRSTPERLQIAEVFNYETVGRNFYSLKTAFLDLQSDTQQ